MADGRPAPLSIESIPFEHVCEAGVCLRHDYVISQGGGGGVKNVFELKFQCIKIISLNV